MLILGALQKVAPHATFRKTQILNNTTAGHFNGGGILHTMIDLHCHILPGIDDGAEDKAMALEMARIAAQDGITTIACTPHIYPGMYENDAQGIRNAISSFQQILDDEGISIKLVQGADVHMVPGLVEGIKLDKIPTINGTRYLLLEPPHHVAPPNMEETVFELMAAGYMPVITHPERLRWVENQFDMFKRLSERGVWMQITAGALTGRFGKRPLYWAEKFLTEGMCDIIATDAHHPTRRPPYLKEAQEAAAKLVGEDEARRMVYDRPQAILDDKDPSSVERPVTGVANHVVRKIPTGMFERFRRFIG